MSDSGSKSCASAVCAARTLACVHGWPSSATSACAARFTVPAMPPKASRTAATVLSLATSIAKPPHSAEMSQSKRLLIL